jgi:cell division septation protein DedD
VLTADCPPPGGSADPAWNTPIAPTGDQHPAGAAEAPQSGRFWPPPPQIWALAAVAVAVSALALADMRVWPPDLFGSHPAAVATPAQTPLTPVVPGSARPSPPPGAGAPAASSAARAPAPAPAPAQTQAAATVRGYFAAISRKDYHRAWAMGGRSINPSYRSFAQGLRHTARDTVTILSVAGPEVRARLRAQDSDGTVQTFQGTYEVHGGVITGFRVRRIS